jgi:hypothetical protein
MDDIQKSRSAQFNQTVGFTVAESYDSHTAWGRFSQAFG